MSWKKFDVWKNRWDLLPMDVMDDVVNILTMWSVKYSDHWRRDVEDKENRYYSALIRHLSQYKQGIEIDEESWKSHLAHVIVNWIFLLYFKKHNGRD